jgi:hypothetical protein
MLDCDRARNGMHRQPIGLSVSYDCVHA